MYTYNVHVLNQPDAKVDNTHFLSFPILFSNWYDKSRVVRSFRKHQFLLENRIEEEKRASGATQQ